MKNAFKKIISALGVLAIIALPTLANASAITVTGPQPRTTDVYKVTGLPSGYIRTYRYDTTAGVTTFNLTGRVNNYQTYPYYVMNSGTAGHSYTIIFLQDTSNTGITCLNHTLTWCEHQTANPLIFSFKINNITSNIWTLPPTGLVFFGGKTSGTGGTPLTNTGFITQTANALNATTSGIYPIIALVIGLFLTAVLSTKIITMFKQAGTTKESKTNINKPLRKQTALYNKDGKLAGFRFD